MLHADALEQTIHDRQARYRHEAYRHRFAPHPVREWLGDRLVMLGEAMRGAPFDVAVAPAERLRHSHLA